MQLLADRHAPLLALLQHDPDVVLEQLCEGAPRNFIAECAAHVEDNAYFIEGGRVAARVIATLAMISGPRRRDEGAISQRVEVIETVIEEATTDILEEGPLAIEEGGGLAPKIGRVLGVSDAAGHRLIQPLNEHGFEDRHVLYHCIVRGLTPEAYARRFDDDARIVATMLREIAKLAVLES